MSAPEYVVRPAGPADVSAFKQLREIAGSGFTSLMIDDTALAERLEHSQASFAAKTDAPGGERYFLGLEHLASGQLAGCSAVKATIGSNPPFFNFRIITEAQASTAADRRFDMEILIGVNDFTGCSEVGSLFVRPEHRAAGIGRALAQCRYMLMAAAPQRFNERVVSELRGVVSAEGRSAFWDAVGRHFFKMEFDEADRLSATSDNQFILDLTPQHPIYVDLLPEAAREVIGRCHPDGRGARRLLEWEGFSFGSVVDIFDGGPLMTATRDTIRTRREAKHVRLTADKDLTKGRRALIASPRVASFRCAPARAELAGGMARVHPATLSALRLSEGDEALVWVDNES